MRKPLTALLTAGAVLVAGAGATVLTAGPAMAGHEVTVLTTKLDGKNEVPTKGDPNGRGKATVFGVDGNPDRLCYTLKVSKIDTATGAHIHEAAEGVNGPVVVSLAPPSDGDSAGCVDTPLAQEILSSPQDYYVNVHNAEYPGGALRGQLG
ncbi:CHRD domain-containing protein [Kineococcus xinjiangensis]|uniref:CHRD domain-containing protein n=1 Tax=Kineococcus xinjiangensis TaxID=512762 RepID=A0A2S6IUR1_9ACTN|nr:CHRD domain-containing protein [Kineococcus xinjiangensis]PPK97919.1 CHRD domain-containing protein [Kineococcus xinjiangensis]